MSTILAALLAGKFGVPTNRGQLEATKAIQIPATHDFAASAAADSFATTFVWALILLALCLIPALFLPKRRPAAPAGADTSEAEGDKVNPAALMH